MHVYMSVCIGLYVYIDVGICGGMNVCRHTFVDVRIHGCMFISVNIDADLYQQTSPGGSFDRPLQFSQELYFLHTFHRGETRDRSAVDLLDPPISRRISHPHISSPSVTSWHKCHQVSLPYQSAERRSANPA